MVTVLQDVINIHTVTREPGRIATDVKCVVVDVTAFAIAACLRAFHVAVDIKDAGIHPGFPAFVSIHINADLNAHGMGAGLRTGRIIQFGFTGVANHSCPGAIVFINARFNLVTHTLVHVTQQANITLTYDAGEARIQHGFWTVFTSQIPVFTLALSITRMQLVLKRTCSHTIGGKMEGIPRRLCGGGCAIERCHHFDTIPNGRRAETRTIDIQQRATAGFTAIDNQTVGNACAATILDSRHVDSPFFAGVIPFDG